MKILFLCGSLEPGRDGVGDYTRRLAIELIKQGYQIAAVALNDPHVTSEVYGTQQLDSIELPVLRIPSNWRTKKRFGRAKEWIDNFDPEWLSLQYVPFSFNSKGLPFRFGARLSKLGQKRKWHIMFHELWVGMDSRASKKHIFWGWVQRLLIKSLISKLHPSIVHTQTKLYQAQLTKLNVKAELLPLFSNIPIINKSLFNLGCEKFANSNNEELSFVLFGTIHPYAEVELFLKEVAQYKIDKGKEIFFQAIGRCGAELKRWVELCNYEGLRIEVLGELSEECISKVLQNASIGITTTVLPLVEKSGTVAAMQEHGLPVLCIGGPWQPRGIKVSEAPAGVIKFRKEIRSDFFSARNIGISHGVSEVSKQFIESIKFYK